MPDNSNSGMRAPQGNVTPALAAAVEMSPAGAKRQARQFRANQREIANQRSKDAMTDVMPAFVNWDYSNWREVWRAIRHAMIGEIAIKGHTTTYLPQPEGMDQGLYRAYLDRGVFYNMVYRTVTGLTGSIFRREPRQLKFGPKLADLSKRISKDGMSLTMFAKVVAQEMLSTGRYGVLADKARSDSTTVKPYLAGYTCENILDWSWTEIDGRNEWDYILLREFTMDRRLFVMDGTSMSNNANYGQLFNAYRVLRLVYNDETLKWEYIQEYYVSDTGDATLMEDPIISQPLIYGVPMNRIPFAFFNATTNAGDIEKPPVLDILTLNLSHYKTYAQLQHGRYFTANPVYTVSGAQEEDEYHIGPSTVWEIGKGEKAEILEYRGLGLKSLENALESIETQSASLGGRLIGESASAGQSDNQIALKDRNEQSLLLNVTTVMNENFTFLLGVLAEWMNEPANLLTFRVNQDFLLDQGAAREFRAITMMYQAGIIPIEIIYEYFLKAEVIPEYVTQEMFLAMLEDAKQFPNNPDFAARKAGYADARQREAIEMTQRELDEEAREFDEAQDHEVDMAQMEQAHTAAITTQQGKTAVAVAKEQAASTPDIPPVPQQGRQAMQKDGGPQPAGPVVKPPVTPKPTATTPTPKPPKPVTPPPVTGK